MGKVDLHTHTTASDGSCSPENLIKLASEKSIETLSITDHDTIKGYLKARLIATSYGIKLLPGVELTALWGRREIHLLGYCFDPDDPGILSLMGRQRRARVDRMEQILYYLGKKGVDVTLEEVKSVARGGTIGRPHVAAILVRKRIVATSAEAFIRYLGVEVLNNINIDYISMEEAVAVLKSAGGVTSLAHPGRLYTPEEVQDLLHFGLDGLECIHPAHNYSLQKQYLEWASDKNLLVTGGSDFHGTHDDYHPFFGVVTLSAKRALEIERASERRKEIQ